MLRLGDSETIESNSNLLLLSDNRTNKYLPSLRRRKSKDNLKKKCIAKHESIEQKLQSKT